MNVEQIRDMLREEQAAGHTPERAVRWVIERIGRHHLREALEALLLNEAHDVAPSAEKQRDAAERRARAREELRRQLARPCTVCSTTGHRELYPLDPGSYYSYAVAIPNRRAAGEAAIETTETVEICSTCRDQLPGDTREATALRAEVGRQ